MLRFLFKRGEEMKVEMEERLEKSDWWKGGETSSILFNNSELKVEFVCIHKQ